MLTFPSIQTPASWIRNGHAVAELTSISIVLDGEKVEDTRLIFDHFNYSKPLYSFTKIIPELSEGNHSLQLYLHSVSYYYTPTTTRLLHPFEQPMETSSHIVNFSVDTTFSATIGPSPSANPLLDVLASNNLAIISLVVIVAVALISLIYFKKHKPNTELVKKLD
jgi:hypothetical protein